jgi:hypothetical protein
MEIFFGEIGLSFGILSSVGMPWSQNRLNQQKIESRQLTRLTDVNVWPSASAPKWLYPKADILQLPLPLGVCSDTLQLPLLIGKAEDIATLALPIVSCIHGRIFFSLLIGRRFHAVFFI